MKEFDFNQLISLCKRRGFIFQDSEIYGGINGFWDYGPLGVELKRNIRELWWMEMVTKRNDVVGMDSSIINHPKTWEASGHVESFTDPMIDCKNCKKRFRADEITGDKCPECDGELTEAKQFNLMFRTHIGASADSSSEAFLRPETAQAIFTNFKNVLDTSRQKVPFGIAQTGKSFRNEINPRNFTFRSREFEQMEMEFFVHPSEREKWFEYWVESRLDWYAKAGIKKENLKLREHSKEELAHYSARTIDVEYYFPFGWQELEGIADRGDFDLSRHIEHSGKDLSYFDPFTQEKFVPYVIETSAGLDRTLLTVLADAYDEEKLEEETRTVLHLSPSVAPIQVAVFPLHKKLKENAEKLESDLRKQGLRTFYDDRGAIGRLYRRQDEAGTPFCLTFDFDSLEDNAVTVRNRDTMQQERVNISQLTDHLRNLFKNS
jgi:glycyl-tRNA synthetase